MKTLGKLIRRYVLAGVGLALGLAVLNIVIFLGIILGVAYQKYKQIFVYFYPSDIASSFTCDPDGTLHPGAEHSEEEWFAGYEWAMMLDDAGQVIWQYRLPDELNHPYTVREVVSFSRWYLDDYPVMSYLNEYGTLVLGRPRGSLNRYNFYMDSDFSAVLFQSVPLALLANLLFIALPCTWFAWRMHRRLRGVETGLQELAGGRPVRLPEKGTTAALAHQLNQTSEHLRRQSAIIARRDAARTDWIAGVSHDIRTPLALIFGHAEALEQNPGLPPSCRAEARAIRQEGQTIRDLIEDLNLTSKLEYDSQPLRRTRVGAAALLRQAVTDFCNSGQAERCPVEFELSPEAQAAVLDVDAPLLRRAFANLLGNSARHNPGGCGITVSADVQGGALAVTVADTGAGYPLAVLACLQGQQPEGTPPHILGLHIVAQIGRAHGGRAEFAQNAPHGARCVLTLPLAAARPDRQNSENTPD